MARGESSSESPVLELLRRRIRKHVKIAKTKTLRQPIVAALVNELGELRSNLTSALAEKLPQTMATTVLITLSRRIKKFRNKYDHIIQMEELLAKGENLKKEQEEVLSSKPIVTALIKELSELTSRLISALAEELCQICDLKPNQSDHFFNTDDQIENLLFLVNLASVRSQSEFPVVMLTRRYERGCCIFDYMTDEEVHLLSENDLNFLSFLEPLVSSQPVNEIGSHKSAFQATATYAAGWNDKLKKITLSEDSTVPSDSTKVDIATANDEKGTCPMCRHAYLKGDGGSKKKERTEVRAQSLTPKMKRRSDLFRYAFNYSYICSADKAAAHLDSLDDKFKQSFLVVPAFKLVKNFESSRVRNFLLDAVLFYKLHGTWEIYVCPKPGCFRWFKEDASLISHLKNEHLPMFHRIDTWPPSQHIPAEGKRCVDALCKMVWKPIHLRGALGLLSRMYLDHACANKADVCAGCDQFCSLEWPLSKDPVRSKLLAKLGRGFRTLLNKENKASYSLLSRGYFTKMTVLAFENIVASVAPSDKVLFLGCTLAHSPLSFRFLEEKALSLFVHLVSKMCQLVMQGSAPSLDGKLDLSRGDVDWNKSEILDAVSFSLQKGCFLLDRASIESPCCGEGSIPSRLCSAPCYRSVTQVPVEASKVFVELENKLVSLMHSVLAVKSRFTALICGNQWASFRYPWLESGFKSKMEPLELDQLELGCELECLEPQVRHLCALDLHMHILPLLRSFFREKVCMCSSLVSSTFEKIKNILSSLACINEADSGVEKVLPGIVSSFR
ncbi:uncharacterized protein LOC144568114 isoform X2 [Carex rostrata]